MELGAAFTEAFGTDDGIQFAFAPGRVNLIGEHTDYNDGFVLPMAIDRYVGVAYRPSDEARVCAFAPDYQERHCLRFDDLRPGRPRGWMAYVGGVLWALRAAGFEPRGMDLVVLGHVPIGAGLSSSAALEMAVLRAACENSTIPWHPAEMAVIAQRAEREYVGVSCGIMDQFASAVSAAGCALLLDCRSLTAELVPIPRPAAIVVMDTGVRRDLAGSAYNERYAQCQEAVRIVRAVHPDVRALRDVTPDMLAELRTTMDPLTYRRASHVVDEMLRPGEMARALDAGDLAAAGRLMNDSHRSLHELYEVSSPELDTMVRIAREHPACYGARLTGAGFAGCAVALLDRGGLDDFIDTVTAAYRAALPHPAELFACEPAPGAAILP